MMPHLEAMLKQQSDWWSEDKSFFFSSDSPER
jgi:hypothetical protein